MVYSGAQYEWPWPKNTDLDYPNSVVQHGISFMKFYSKRNKVINENTFQIHHWALCGWVLVLGERGENPAIGFRWYLRASLALWLVEVGFYWVTAFQQVFICQSQDVRFDFVSHRSFCPTRSGWGMALRGFRQPEMEAIRIWTCTSRLLHIHGVLIAQPLQTAALQAPDSQQSGKPYVLSNCFLNDLRRYTQGLFNHTNTLISYTVHS